VDVKDVLRKLTSSRISAAPGVNLKAEILSLNVVGKARSGLLSDIAGGSEAGGGRAGESDGGGGG
jgi:hypothetical protein